MSSLPATVADLYRYVGVDTHAAAHSYAIIAAASGVCSTRPPSRQARPAYAAYGTGSGGAPRATSTRCLAPRREPAPTA